MRRTTVISCLCVGVLIGLFAGRRLHTWPLVFAACIVFSVASIWVRRSLAMAALMIGFAAGALRASSAQRSFDVLSGYFETKVQFVVESLEDAEYNDKGQLEFIASKAYDEINDRDVPGQYKVSGFGITSVQRGDIIRIKGKLFSSFGSSQARMGFADMELIDKNQAWYDTVRREFINGIRAVLPEPEASFAVGLLIGQRSTIPVDVSTSLRDAGLAHIVAVSGYNLTIIVRAVMGLLRHGSRYQRLLLCASVSGIFVLFTGFSASIVRAAIVTLLSLGAWYFGKRFVPHVLLLLVAAMTAWYRPQYVWGDVSWYLSFLAFASVLVVAPLVIKRMFTRHKPKQLTQLLIETSSVLAVTTPYVLFIFGQTSIVAIVANILVVPLVPLAMLLSLICGMVGVFMPHLGHIITLPTEALLSTLLQTAQVFARLPGSVWHFSLSSHEMMAWYGCIFVVAYILVKQRGVPNYTVNLLE